MWLLEADSPVVSPSQIKYLSKEFGPSCPITNNMYSAGFDLYLFLVEEVKNLMSTKGLSFQGTVLNIFVNRSGGNG